MDENVHRKVEPSGRESHDHQCSKVFACSGALGLPHGPDHIGVKSSNHKWISLCYDLWDKIFQGLRRCSEEFAIVRDAV